MLADLNLNGGPLAKYIYHDKILMMYKYLFQLADDLLLPFSARSSDVMWPPLPLLKGTVE
jgi:hypothetical protein